MVGFRTSDASIVANKGATIGGWTLQPSYRFASSKIFDEVIINQDLKIINTLAIGDGFKVPSPSIFGQEVTDEAAFGKSLFQNRILPKLKNAEVYLETNSVFPVGI